MIWIMLKVNLGLDKWDLCFVIYMFLSNNPSSGGYKFVEFVLLKHKNCLD